MTFTKKTEICFGVNPFEKFVMNRVKQKEEQMQESNTYEVKIFEIRTKCGEDLCIFAHAYEEGECEDIWFYVEKEGGVRELIAEFPRGSWSYVIDKDLHSDVRDVYSAQQAKEREREKKPTPDIQKSAEEFLEVIKNYTRNGNG